MANDEVIGYCDPNGNFMGYDPRMTIIPGMIPAKFKADGTIEYIGNPQILPKGKIIETDAGFGDGPEQINSGLVDDKGAHLARTNAVPVGSMPQAELDKITSVELNPTELDEEDEDEAERRDVMAAVIPEPDDDDALRAKVAARVKAKAATAPKED